MVFTMDFTATAFMGCTAVGSTAAAIQAFTADMGIMATDMAVDSGMADSDMVDLETAVSTAAVVREVADFMEAIIEPA
jgi:hypothetical protein